MLAESGLVLALDSDKIKVGGGVWTPAACQVSDYLSISSQSLLNLLQGELLTKRLVDTGSSLTVE